MSETYTIEFPIIIPSSMEIAIDEISRYESTLKFTLSNKEVYYCLKIEGFKEESEAVEYICKINAGLLWLTLNKGLPTIALLQPQKFEYSDDSERAAKNLNAMGKNYLKVDALVDSNKPVVYKSDRVIAKSVLYPPTISAPFSGEEVFESIIEGISFDHGDKIIQDKKLKVAIELYGAYFTENSDNARFLTLVMALEVLTDATKRPGYLLRLINKWEGHLKNCEDELSNDTDKLKEIASIKSSLGNMKNNSLTKELQNLVLSSLEQNGDQDATDMAELMKHIYDDRSRLVHNGFLETQKLKNNIRNTKNLVERILKIKFLDIQNKSHN